MVAGVGRDGVGNCAQTLGVRKLRVNYVMVKGSDMGLISSAEATGVGDAVVVKGGGVTDMSLHMDDQATLPCGASESVGDAILAYVVVVWFPTRVDA